tara:strand:- start:542 stop:712 length:171 start_codon:yes stop_codon:yes gene_type:complete
MVINRVQQGKSQMTEFIRQWADLTGRKICEPCDDGKIKGKEISFIILDDDCKAKGE